MPVHRGRTFRSGNSEAVRLPKHMGFGEDAELLMVRSGEVLTIYRAPATLAEMIERLRHLPAPPEIERREGEEPTARPGL